MCIRDSFWKKGKKSKYESDIDLRGAIRLPANLVKSSGLVSGDIFTLEKQDDNSIKALFHSGSEIPEDLMYANKVNGTNVPPGWICQSFTSNPSSLLYYSSGDSSVENFNFYLNKHGVDPNKLECILDFGCGAGRVLSAYNRTVKAKLFGIDLHKDAIKWCKKFLPFGQFEFGKDFPPLSYESNQFDFIYAISVFTHLNEEMQDAWFKEFKRIAKPNAILIISYRAEDYIIDTLGAKRASKIIEGLIFNDGFVFLEHNTWGGIFPEFYCDTFQTHKYVREHWGKYFEVLEQLPIGSFSNKQNAVILRNSL